MRPPVVVSACLAGVPCKWSGGHNAVPEIVRLRAMGRCLPVCPETLGGLSVPRPPCEIAGDEVLTADGESRTAEYRRGAERALAMALESGARTAVLKARSPSCGAGAVYDGTFTRTLRAGDGVFAAMLRERGFELRTEEDFRDLPDIAE